MLSNLLNDPDLANALSDLLVALLSLVATLVLPWVGVMASRYFGVRIEEKHMRALHEATLTWAETAVKHGVGQANAATATDLRAYLAKSVPDAMKVLGPGADVLMALATRYLAQARAKVGA